MTFTIDKFLRPISPGDKNIIIYDDNGKAIHTINPYSVKNTFVNNNLLKISLASDRVITLNFISIELAKTALYRLQQNLEVFKNQKPIYIDKQVEKYVGDVFDTQKYLIDNIIESANSKANYIPRWISATALSATSSIWDDGQNRVKIGFTNSIGIGSGMGSGLFSIQGSLQLPASYSLSRPYPNSGGVGDYFNGDYGSSFSTVAIEGVVSGLTPNKLRSYPSGFPSSWSIDSSPLTRMTSTGWGTTLLVESASPYLLSGQLQNQSFFGGQLVSGPNVVTHFKGADPVFIWEQTASLAKRLSLESTNGKFDFWTEAYLPGSSNELTFQRSSGGYPWRFIVTATAATGSTFIQHTFANYSVNGQGYLFTGDRYSTYSLVPKLEFSDIITFSSHFNLGVGMEITGSARRGNTTTNIFTASTFINELFADGKTVRLSRVVRATFSATDLLTVSGPITSGTKNLGPALDPVRGYYGTFISSPITRQLRVGESIYLGGQRGAVQFGGNVGIKRSAWATQWSLDVAGDTRMDRMQTGQFTLYPTTTLSTSTNLLVGNTAGLASWVPATQVLGSGFTGTSSTQLTIGTVGSYFQIRTQTNLSFKPGQVVVVYDELGALYIDPNYQNGFGYNRVIAEIDGYNINSGTLSLVTLDARTVGSSSNSWSIQLSGAVGPQGPAGFNQGTFSVTGDIIPALDYTYNLGSTVSRWNNIYVKDAIVASQSLYIGKIKISEENEVIKVDNRAINKYEGKSNTSYKIGNVGSIATLQTDKYLSYFRGDSVKVQNQFKNYYESEGYSELSIHGYFIGVVDSYDRDSGQIEILITFTESIGFESDKWFLKLNSDTLGFETTPVNIDGIKLLGTSSTTMRIPNVGEVREFYTQNKLGFYAGQSVIVYNELPNNYEDDDYVEGNGRYFIGKVDYYYTETGFLTVLADYVYGSGTFSNWTITVSSLPNNGLGGPQGVTGPQGEVGSTGPQGETGPAGPLGTTASFEELTVIGPSNIQQVIEVLTTSTATGLSPSTFNLNFDDGSIFYVEPEGDNFVANYLNVPTTDNRIISTTIIISQTSSAYIPNVVAINGDIIPISWSGGSLPTGNANQTDIVGFSFMRIGATWSKVFGQLSTFATI